MMFSASFKLACLSHLSIALKGMAYAQNENSYLENKRERDEPIPLYKSLSEILSESWWIPALAGGIVLTIIFAFWLRSRLKKSESAEKSIPARDPYEEAIEALNALEAECHKMDAKPFVFRLSEVLRVYVERCFALRAMELTGEEFLREVAGHKFFRKRYDDLLHEFVDRSDMVKYSRESIDGEGLRLLLDSAKHFVIDSHSRLKEEATTTNDKPSEGM